MLGINRHLTFGPNWIWMSKVGIMESGKGRRIFQCSFSSCHPAQSRWAGCVSPLRAQSLLDIADSSFSLWLCKWLVAPCCWDKPRAFAPLSVAFSNPVCHLLNCSEISNLACYASFQGLFEIVFPINTLSPTPIKPVACFKRENTYQCATEQKSFNHMLF